MPEEFVDRAYLDIDGITIECVSITPKDTNELNPVKTMNPLNRSRGWTSGIPDFEYSAVVPLSQDGSRIPWRRYMRERTEFTTTIQYEGSDEAITYTRCRIADVEQGSEEGSRTDTTIEVKALDTADN